jgi:hypothetical protein
LKSRKLLQCSNNEGTSKIAIKVFHYIAPNCIKRNGENPLLLFYLTNEKMYGKSILMAIFPEK